MQCMNITLAIFPKVHGEHTLDNWTFQDELGVTEWEEEHLGGENIVICRAAHLEFEKLSCPPFLS